MNRLLLALYFLLAGTGAASAQLAAEWLRQNQTQRRYLAIQIAALKQYLSYAREGYQIVSGGIRAVGQVKRGDLGIHSLFFSSLQRVSPFVRRHRKVLDLTGSYLALLDHCRRMRSRWATLEGLPAWKRDILANAYLQFVDDLAGDLTFLAELMIDGHFELNDAERLARVDQLATRQAERNARIRLLSSDFGRSAEAVVRNGQEFLHFKNLLP